MFYNILDKLAKNEKLKKAFISLGEDNKATYAAMAIAAAKGIFRPMFTMLDKDEDPKTKKYTALREGLTEVIAIPTYWVSGEIAGKLADKIEKTPEKLPIAKANMRFLGVCVATLLIIPGLCSCVVKPFTSMIFKDNKNKEEENNNQVKTINYVDTDNEVIKFRKLQRNNTQIYNKTNYSMSTYMNNGMRV